MKQIKPVQNEQVNSINLGKAIDLTERQRRIHFTCFSYTVNLFIGYRTKSALKFNS